MARIHNFSAGPGVLPLEVLEQIKVDIFDLNQSGIGLMECSHRSALYDAVIESARKPIASITEP